MEFILNGILEEEIQIQELFIQKEFINPDENKKSIIMDTYIIDTNGNSYCLDIQNDLSKAPPERLRFYSSMSDYPLLDKGSKDFKELKSNTIIFLCAKDKYKEGKPLYSFIYKEEVSNHPLKDGSRLIYVNGAYKGNHRIGDIVHDMKCSKPEECRLPIFKETLKYYKTERGEKAMCEKVERFVEERVSEMRDELEKEVREKVRKEVMDEVTQEIRKEDDQNRLAGLKKSILSLMNNLKINVDYAMELMNLDKNDRIKIMHMM